MLTIVPEIFLITFCCCGFCFLRIFPASAKTIYLFSIKIVGMKRYGWLLFLILLLSCGNLAKKETDNSNENQEKALEAEEATSNNGSDILNNIILHQSGGLQIAQAYLSLEDGTLVPRTNKVPLATPVYLNLLVKKGWVFRNGEASVDATEVIRTNNGELVLDAPNLFKSKPTVSQQDASRIYLKANIISTRPDISYFVINYHVWDNWGKGEVKGSYRLYIDDTPIEK
jgi:hypothetical protein